MASEEQDAPSGLDLPPPPPVVPAGVTPIKGEALEPKKPKLVPLARRGLGSRGQKIQLLTNHFSVKMPNSEGFFFQYFVKINYEDGPEADAKGIGRRVIEKLQETYGAELYGKHFIYDGEKTLFTLGALPNIKLEFTVVLEDQHFDRAGGQGSPGANGSPKDSEKKRLRRQHQSKTFKVEISYSTKIPLQAITNALRGEDTEQFHEAVRVLDIILRQHAARKGCLLVHQSFFHNEPHNFADIGGGVLGKVNSISVSGPKKCGLSLNIGNVSTPLIGHPGPVIAFLLANQNARHPNAVDLAKGERMLKNLRITLQSSNAEYKITGLSDKPCRHQMRKNGDGEVQSIDYFVQYKNISPPLTGDDPCIKERKPKKISYIPPKLCCLVSLQRNIKARMQRARLVEKSLQRPPERMRVLTDIKDEQNPWESARKTSLFEATPRKVPKPGVTTCATLGGGSVWNKFSAKECFSRSYGSSSTSSNVQNVTSNLGQTSSSSPIAGLGSPISPLTSDPVFMFFVQTFFCGFFETGEASRKDRGYAYVRECGMQGPTSIHGTWVQFPSSTGNKWVFTAQPLAIGPEHQLFPELMRSWAPLGDRWDEGVNNNLTKARYLNSFWAYQYNKHNMGVWTAISDYIRDTLGFFRRFNAGLVMPFVRDSIRRHGYTGVRMNDLVRWWKKILGHVPIFECREKDGYFYLYEAVTVLQGRQGLSPRHFRGVNQDKFTNDVNKYRNDFVTDLNYVWYKDP